MAPAVLAQTRGGPPAPTPATMRAAMRAMRREIEAKTKDVGKAFPQEARDMHLGILPEAPIRGEATLEEARALVEEGVPVMPMPPVLDEVN